MKEKTPRELRAMICRPGYYNRRIRYYRRQAIYYESLAARPNYPNTCEAVENAIRCNLKAEWYRKRIGTETPVKSEPVFELELTRDLYESAVINYGPSVHGIFKHIFGIQVPDEWKKTCSRQAF